MTTRAVIHLGGTGGSLRIQDEEHDNPCYICGSTQEVYLVVFKPADKARARLHRRQHLFLRACGACLDVVQSEKEAMRARPVPTWQSGCGCRWGDNGTLIEACSEGHARANADGHDLSY